MMFLRILFFSLFITNIGFTQKCSTIVFKRNTNVLNDRICPDALVEDLKVLYKNILNTHPDLYRNATKEKIDSAYNLAIQQCLDEKTIYEFTLIINDFLSTIQDSHTFLNFRELLYYSYGNRHFLPFWIAQIENKYYITKSWKNVFPKGAELLLVNGTSVANYKDESVRLTPQESNTIDAKQEMSSLLLGSLINLKHLEKTNNYVFVVGKDTLEKKIKSPKIYRVLQESEYLSDQSPVNLRLMSKTAVLSISTFSPSSISRFKNQLDQAFLKIEKLKIKNLIIDVRYNTGGYIMLQEYLMSFLMKPEDHYAVNYVYKRSENDRFEQLPRTQLWKFKRTAKRYYPNGAISKEFDFYNSPMGTIDTVLNDPVLKNKNGLRYIDSCSLLVNGMSMSASVNFAAWFEHSKRGEIRGSCAMGTNTGTFANPAIVLLPNTLLPVLVSTMKINPVWNETVSEKILCPNKAYTPTHKDVFENIDPLLMEVIKN